jgi:hypothetical protein
MPFDRNTALDGTAIGMCFRDRKEELPSFKGCTRTSCLQTFDIDGFYRAEIGIGFYAESLPTEFIVHVVMDAPEPFGELGLVTFYRVAHHVLGETFAAIFTWKNIGEHAHELTDFRTGICSKTYKM